MESQFGHCMGAPQKCGFTKATADGKCEKTIPMKLKGVVPELGTEPQGSSVPDKVGK
jgi:hypothetical protein